MNQNKIFDRSAVSATAANPFLWFRTKM